MSPSGLPCVLCARAERSEPNAHGNTDVDIAESQINANLVQSRGDAGPLLKALRSIPGIPREPDSEFVACAIVFTNDYKGMKWVLNRVDSKKMDLPGLAQDRRNLWESVPKIFPSIRVTLVEKTFYQDMEKHLVNAAEANPATILISFQGHGQNGHYVTADGHYPGFNAELKVFLSKDVRRMLSEWTPNAWRILLTDYCGTGNFFRLRFMLVLDEQAPKWVQTLEWDPNTTSDNKDTPTLHFSACTEHERSWGDARFGGYHTEAFTSMGNRALTLPELLTSIRKHVVQRLSIENPNSRIQTPQIYSNCILPLDDPRVLQRFYWHDIRL